MTLHWKGEIGVSIHKKDRKDRWNQGRPGGDRHGVGDNGAATKTKSGCSSDRITGATHNTATYRGSHRMHSGH